MTEAKKPDTKAKMIKATLMKSTIHSGAGITPSAPCVRSARAFSRSERWSNHFE